ncbi:MAG: hypothetical protein AABY86_08815, partial [Bdellovibrionota bacterium]
ALKTQIIEGAKVLAKFTLLGEKKISVALPDNASDAFYFKNRARIIYATPPSSRLFTLDSSSPEVMVEFAFPKGYKVKNNALFYHRYISELKMDVLLCSQLRTSP